jgi:hypothetical protein
VSFDPLEGYAQLKAENETQARRIESLETENATLKARSNGNGHFDQSKLLEAIGSRIDRSGQVLREDFTGKLAGLIAPYIDTTIRRCSEMEERQDDLEATFERHRKNVAGAAAELETAFVKMRKESAKDWKAQRDQIQADFAQVDVFVKWFLQEIEKNVRTQSAGAGHLNKAVSACESLTKQMTAPVEKTIERLRAIEERGERTIDEAEQHLRNTYQRLRQPVLKRVTWLMAVCLVTFMSLAFFTMWSMKRALDNDAQDMAARTEQQKQELQGMLDKSIRDARQAEIVREVKSKMWDDGGNVLTPQQRQVIWEHVKEQLGMEDAKRAGDQVSAGRSQSSRKRK